MPLTQLDAIAPKVQLLKSQEAKAKRLLGVSGGTHEPRDRRPGEVGGRWVGGRFSVAARRESGWVVVSPLALHRAATRFDADSLPQSEHNPKQKLSQVPFFFF